MAPTHVRFYLQTCNIENRTDSITTSIGNKIMKSHVFYIPEISLFNGVSLNE